jgi:hypothetical protein
MNQSFSLDSLAKNYEEDLRYLIYQTSSSDYESLIDSFYILTDLFCLIQKLERLESCQVNVLSPTEITNPEVLEQLHIEASDKRRVRDFLRYVESSKGKKFEQLINKRIEQCQSGSETDYSRSH